MQPKITTDKGKTTLTHAHIHTTQVTRSLGRCRPVSQKVLAGVGRCHKKFWQVLAPSMALPCPANPTTTTPTHMLWNRAQHEQDYTELQRTITYRTGHRDPHNRYWSPLDSGYHRYMSQDLNSKNGGLKQPHCVGLWGRGAEGLHSHISRTEAIVCQAVGARKVWYGRWCGIRPTSRGM